MLDGAPAGVMAVSARAHVSVAQRSGDIGSLHCPGFHDQPLSFSYDSDGRLRLSDDGADLSLFHAVWQRGPAKIADVILDTHQFYDPRTGYKFGIGSSAALVTALLAARGEANLQTADQVHRQIQGGRGSGIDTAAAVLGGAQIFRLGQAPKGLDWPDGLTMRVLWSGKPATTSSRVARYLEKSDRASLAAPLTEACNLLLQDWQDNALAALENYTQVLEAFSEQSGLGIFDAGHAEIRRLAAEQGLVYKPSGAGGGDVGLLFAEDESELEPFVADCGFTALPLVRDETGVCCEEEQD